MLRKSFLAVVLSPFFLIPGVASAQNYPATQNYPASQFLPGQGRSQMNFPGRRGNAPKGMRWVPGHYEIRGGQKMWVRGNFVRIPGEEQNSGDFQTVPSVAPPWNPNQQIQAPGNLNKGAAASFASPSQNQFVPPTSSQTGVAPPVSGQIVEKQAPSSNVRPQGWAVVIGISKYKYAAGKFPELRYANRDAKAFNNFLISPEGGGFPPERVLFLEDANATLQNIKYAFFDFLKQALEEDFVIIYFAGHGTPEESNSENLYLMTYDSRPNQLASTAFPMWDINTAFYPLY